MSSTAIPASRSGLFAVIGLLLIAVICHASAWGGFWTFDDPQLILHALRVPATATLFQPAEYQKLATHTFTPLLPISFKLDVILGKLSPAFYYVHQWLSLTLSALLLFALLRRYVTLRSAFFGAAIFLASWPAVYAARTLMIRHYVEGLLLAIVALLAFSQRNANRERIADAEQRVADLLAAFFYLLAMLEKELYVPLILLFAVQSSFNGDALQRTVRRLVAPVIALAIFAAWRTFMLESLGGYEQQFGIADLVRLPWTVARQLGGPAWNWSAAVLLLVLVAGFVLSFRARRRETILLAVVAFVVLFAPIVGLAGSFEWRFTFAFAPLLAALIVLGLDRAEEESRHFALVLPVLLLILIGAAIMQARAYQRINAIHVAEGKCVYAGDSSAPLMLASSPAWYLSGLSELRNIEGRGMGPRVTNSMLPATANGFDPGKIISYNEASGRFEPLGGRRRQVVEERRKMTSGIPYSIAVSEKSDVLTWDLRSTKNAKWFFVTLPSHSEFPVPPSGSRRIPEASQQQFFRMKLVFDDGLWSITPELPMPNEGEKTIWRNLSMK